MPADRNEDLESERKLENLTETITKQYRNKQDAADDMLTEVLCSAFKDATGAAPSDRLRDKLYEAIHYERR